MTAPPVEVTHDHRARRQTWSYDWINKVLAKFNITRRVRAFRFLEEALELVQTQGLTLDDVIKQAAYTYGRPVGQVKEEIGATALSLYALAEDLGISVDSCEADELIRCHGLNPTKVQAKEALKREYGLE